MLIIKLFQILVIRSIHEYKTLHSECLTLNLFHSISSVFSRGIPALYDIKIRTAKILDSSPMPLNLKLNGMITYG